MRHIDLRIGYKRVSMPLCEIPDTPLHIQGDDMSTNSNMYRKESSRRRFIILGDKQLE